MPPLPRVAAFAAGEVGGEIFDVDLVSCPVCGYLLQGHAAVLDDQDGLDAVGGKRRLDDAVRYVWGASQNLEPTWGLAHVHATRAFPSARKETCTELTTLTQITFHLAEPAGETAGIGER